MFTVSMYDRLSEWLSNLSLLFLASSVFPSLFGGIDTGIDLELLFGIILSLVCLWISLRLARIAEREK